MSSGEQLKNTLEIIKKDFKIIFKEISDYLKKPLPDEIFDIKIQPKRSKVDVPKVGDKYGVYYKSDNLILANWLFDLRVKEQETIIEYLLVREIFRYYFRDDSIDQLKFDRLIEVVCHALAGTWISQIGKDKSLSDKKIRYIDQRSAFEDTDEIMGHDWAVIFAMAIKYKLSVVDLFEKAFSLMKSGSKNNNLISEIDKEYRSWCKSFYPKDTKIGLPQYFDNRHFEIFELLATEGHEQGTTSHIAKKMDLSHDVIHRSFKFLYDDLFIAWYPVKNFLLMRLYPHFFRVTLTAKKHLKPFLDYLHANPYINHVHNTIDANEPIVSVKFACPLILHNQLSSYFEKLQSKGIIKDLFFERIRRRILQCAITRDDLEPTEETFQRLFDNPFSIDFKTLTLLDERLDFDNSIKFNKAIFDPNVLHFMSYYDARYLTKGDFMVHPLPEFFKACENNNIDTSDTKAVTHFVSQLETRCSNLGLIDYKLHIKKLSNYGKSVFLELHDSIESASVNRLLEKLKISYALIAMEFLDRTLLIFPKLNLEHLFIIQVEKQIQEVGIDYDIYHIYLNKDFTFYTPLHQLYDYENQTWKFDQK
ncbi:MAG: hypothetical protein FK733_19220 [Asgard group archaeon]|nr:hypothetical protein [Asgard group archaeon]